MRVAHTHTARNLLENPRSNTGTDKVDFVELCTGLTVICGGKHLDKACCAYNLYDVRGVRARSARISIVSHFHISITSQEYDARRSLIPQESHSKVHARIQTRLWRTYNALEHRYYDTKRPWLSSEEKPEGYLLCTECNFFFARRYCKNCKEHFCIDCHWKCHSKGKRRFHEWDRFDVVKQTCDVCKDRTATVMCHACDGAMYCQKCCDMVHSAKNKRKHDRHDF